MNNRVMYVGTSMFDGLYVGCAMSHEIGNFTVESCLASRIQGPSIDEVYLGLISHMCSISDGGAIVMFYPAKDNESVKRALTRILYSGSISAAVAEKCGPTTVEACNHCERDIELYCLSHFNLQLDKYLS